MELPTTEPFICLNMKAAKEIAPSEYEQRTGNLSDIEFWMGCLDGLISHRRCSSCHHDGLHWKPRKYYLTYEGFGTGVCWYIPVFNGYKLTVAARTQIETIQKAILFFYSEFENLDRGHYSQQYFTNPDAPTSKHPLIVELSKYQISKSDT